MKKKTVRLWKWPEEIKEMCDGCYGEHVTGFSLCDGCEGFIFKIEKPEPEFFDVDVEVDE